MSSRVLKLGAAGLSLVILGILISAIPSFAQESPSFFAQPMDHVMNAMPGEGAAQAMPDAMGHDAMPHEMGHDTDAMIEQCAALMRQMSDMMYGNGMNAMMGGGGGSGMMRGAPRGSPSGGMRSMMMMAR